MSTARPPRVNRYCPGSDQPALRDRGLDEAGEERMRIEWLALELGMVLHPDEPAVIGPLDDLGQDAVGRHAGKDQSALFQPLVIGRVDLVAMAVAFADHIGAVDAAHTAVAR